MVDRLADISSSINLILESMYRRPMTIIRLLEDIGLSKTEINSLQLNHIREFEDIVLDSIDEYFHMAKYRNDFNILVRRLGLRARAETLQEIGDEYGVSRERIRQRQNKVLKRLASPKLILVVENKLLDKIIYSSKKYKKFDTYNEAKNYISKNPGSDIAILDNNEGYLAKVVKTQGSVTEEIQSKTPTSNQNKDSLSNKTVNDYLRSMSLRYFAKKSQCVTHRVKHCILNEVKDFGSLYEFLNDNKTRRDVLRIKNFGRKSFKILNECVENYIDNIKIKIRKNALKNESTSVIKTKNNKLEEVDKTIDKSVNSNVDFFKIENFDKVRMLNRCWTASKEDILKLRKDNLQNDRLLNSGLPFTVEEVELFNKWVEKGKTRSELQDFFQRRIGNIKNTLSKNQERVARGYRDVYWSNNKKHLTTSEHAGYFKIEDYPSTRLINLQWVGGINEIIAIRKENIRQGCLINKGVPISIEEVELYEDFIKQGKSVDGIRDYFQRSIQSLESSLAKIKEGHYKKYQTVYWKTSIDYDTGEIIEFGDAVKNPFNATTTALESVKSCKHIGHISESRSHDNDNWEIVSGTFKEIVKNIKNDRPNHLAIIQNGCFYEVFDDSDISFFTDRFSYNSSSRWGDVAFTGFPTIYEEILLDLRDMKKPFVLVRQLPEKDNKGRAIRAISEVYDG